MSVQIRFRVEEGSVGFDAIVDAILSAFDGAKVVIDDWYEDRRRSTIGIIDKFEKAGTPMPYADTILDSISSAERWAGPRKILAIPMVEGGTLKGDIARHALTLLADRPLTENETVKAIIALLTSLNVVAKIEVHGKEKVSGTEARFGS